MCDLYETIYRWKYRGLLESRERMEEIYWIRECSTNCEKCGKEFKSSQDRCMDHCHTTGKFRNILCTSCNKKRCKIPITNTSGYIGINKSFSKTTNQGFRWRFAACIDGKNKTIKTSIDKEFLIEFAKQWRIDNNYDN